MKVKELRIILTVENLDEIIRFYRDVAGMETSEEWRNEPGSGIILDAGRASPDLIDAKHAATISLFTSPATPRILPGAIRCAYPSLQPHKSQS